MNPFRVLGVDETASRSDIDAAFRSQARALHPDRFLAASAERQAQAHREMAELNFAYELLTDDQVRAQYRRTQQKRRVVAQRPADARATEQAGAPSAATATTADPVDYRSAAASEFTVGSDTVGTPWVAGARRRRWTRRG